MSAKLQHHLTSSTPLSSDAYTTRGTHVTRTPADKFAVLVGINYYGTPSELGGCINDAQNHYLTLTKHFGFAKENIRLLTDQPGSTSLPTSKNIKEAIEWLISSCKDGDIIFFSFSGHGSQMACTDGSEADGKDEILCPLDLGNTSASWRANAIFDNYLNQKFHDELPVGARCVCAFDCCHSGTMADLPFSRGLGDFAGMARSLSRSFSEMFEASRDAAPADEPDKSRYLTPPPEIAAEIAAAEAAAANTTRSRGFVSLALRDPGDARPPSKDVWAISGCMDNQTSADASIDGKRQGAMTWALLQALKENGWEFQYNALLTSMRNKMKGRFTQLPQISTTRDELFDRYYLGTHDTCDEPFAQVIELDVPQPTELEPGHAFEVADITDKEADVFTLGLSWEITKGKNIDLDASAIMLDSKLNQLDLVYFSQLESKVKGCVKHSGDNRSGAGSGDDESLQIDLNAVSAKMPSCQFIGLVINSYSGQKINDVTSASCHLYDNDRPSIDLARVNLSTTKKLDCTAVLLCCLFRSGNKWFMTAICEAAAGKTVRDNVDELQDFVQRNIQQVKQTAPTSPKVRAVVPKDMRPGSSFKSSRQRYIDKAKELSRCIEGLHLHLRLWKKINSEMAGISAAKLTAVISLVSVHCVLNALSVFNHYQVDMGPLRLHH
ncbi:hypothetical protein CYMTET_53129 [Cymbomonas tetramitiformis]|uniref:Uncharacterized protein n=1 Tax=Cymbomonas tetramitiformis TaxID=36881 RepID=A0AAE0BHU8_9CHLO|nr:hypothetical protein CYMTET_53129 [Cymbomonas tetramitiformis]